MEPVDQRVRAFKPSSSLQIGVADHRADIVGLQSTRPALYPRITKAMEGEERFPRLHSIASQRVAVGSLRGPQRSRTQLAILENLSMAQGNCLPRLPLDGYAETTNKVLTEINDGTARRRGGDGNGRDQFNAAYRWPARCNQRCKVPDERSHTNPIVVAPTDRA